MFCRALVIAAAISYLLCVLWLSGIQKEDLDVAMLQKMERHNVNIDDMNGEKLRRDCLQIPEDNTTKPSDIEPEQIYTKTPTMMETTSNNDLKETFNSGLEMIMTDLFNKKMQNKQSNTMKAAGSSTFNPVNDNTKHYYDDQTEPLTSYTGAIDAISNYDKNQPKLDKIIQFWQLFKTTGFADKTDAFTTKKPIDEILDEGLFLDKLLADYIYINQDKTTQNPSNISPVNLHKLQRIQPILKLYPDSKKPINLNNFQKTSGESYLKVGNYGTISNKMAQNINPKTMSIETRNSQFSDNNTSDSPRKYSDGVEQSNISQIPVKIGNSDERGKSPYNKFSIKKEILLTKILENKNTPKQDIISKAVIEEIAASIKALVLKDLRQEINTTLTNPTSHPTNNNASRSNNTVNTHSVTTTAVAVTNNGITTKSQDATEVMEKIMKLFDQLKNLRTDKPPKMKIKITETARINSEHMNPLNVDVRAPLLVFDPTVNKPTDNRIILYSPLGLQAIPMKPENLPNNNVVKEDSIIKQLKQKPIMLQTNSEEIPPLGVPLKKPLQVVHQNIIIQTKHSVKKHKTQQNIYNKHKLSNINTSFKDLTRTSEENGYAYSLNPSIQSKLTNVDINKKSSEQNPPGDTRPKNIQPGFVEKDNPRTTGQTSNTNQKKDYHHSKYNDDKQKSSYQKLTENKVKSYQEDDQSRQRYGREFISKIGDSNVATSKYNYHNPKSMEVKHYDYERNRGANDHQRYHFENAKVKHTEYKSREIDRIKNQGTYDGRLSQYEQQKQKLSNDNHSFHFEDYKRKPLKQNIFETVKTHEGTLNTFSNDKVKTVEQIPKYERLKYDGDIPSTQRDEAVLKYPRYQEYSQLTSQFEKNIPKISEINPYTIDKYTSQQYGQYQSRFEPDMKKIKEQLPKNKLFSQNANQQLPRYEDWLKPMDFIPTTLQTSSIKDDRQIPIRFGDDKLKTLEQLYRNEKLRIQAAGSRQPLYENNSLKLLNRNPFNIDRVRDDEDKQFEGHVKLLEQGLPITYQNGIQKDYLTNDRFRNYGSSLLSGPDSKLNQFAQSSYKMERPKYQTDYHQLSQLINDRSNIFNQNSNDRMVNRDDFGLPLLEQNKLKLMAENFYPSFVEQDKLKRLDQAPSYKKTRFINEQESHASSRFEDGKFNRVDKNKRIIPDRVDNSSLKFEDILNADFELDKPKIYNSKYGDDKISIAAFRGRDRERFHEILEGGDGPPVEGDLADQRMPLASRQQRPLNDIKKASTYDDTHFNNFMKTQQKVNEMLERLLATKAISQNPRSVETT